MSLLLIDDQGEIWAGSSAALRRTFDSPYSGGDFVDYAVLNLGFVALNNFGSSCQVRIRPSMVTDGAYRALKMCLLKVKCERVVITAFDRDWSNELVRSGEVALNRLEQHLVKGRSPKARDFLVRPLTQSELPASTALGQLSRNWSELSRPSGQHELMRLLQVALGDRYVVVKTEPTNGKIVFHEFGQGLFSQYDTWRTCAVGAPVSEQPDRGYGRWIAETYGQAMSDQSIKVDQVDAIVRWPHAGRQRLRYKRLIVPVETQSAGKLLVGGSIIDNMVDLRVGN
jgi:hypothetical protein